MKYEYKGVTGKTAIEVDERYFEILVALDKGESNNTHKYNRHNPASLEDADYEGDWFADDTDILGDLIHAESIERVRAALPLLTSDQRALIERRYADNVKTIDISRQDGVSEAAVRDRLKKIYNRLKKSLN
ncbi:MAG: sigma-70 family RNA polymerase sigma factor [Firmicutes bacterium]|nr:sigma-70 family RNA polymerase sigma factor [Bacillota bacterium]